jgi:CRP-like cAMP-binding protein
MSQVQQKTVRNHLLSGLSPDDFALLAAHLEPVDLELRQVMAKPNTPIEHVYFPETGFASLTTNGHGSKIEIGMIGREGMTGVPVALGADRMPFECFVQLAGRGLRIATQGIEQAIAERPSLHRRLLRYAQALNVQTSATAFANAEHTVEMRLARWVLMCHDRVDGDEFGITHEFLSMMLGVRRAGVTTTLHVLEGHRLIRSKRGSITVLNRHGLEELADDAYGLPEAEYARLLTVGGDLCPAIS